MVKGYWLVVMFAVGVVVGVMFARPHAEAVATAVAPAEQKAPAPVSNSGPVATPHAAKPLVARDPRAEPADKPAVEAVPSNTQSDSSGAVYTGYSEPVDVGPVFRDQFAEAQSHGVRSPLLEFHQALEREVRNDAWAYAAESEIQNSLVADTGVGHFKVDHLECRATLCELRLSARGKEQSEALTRWQQGMRTQPFGNQLEPRASSMIGRDENADILVILVKPEKKAPEKLTKAT